MDLYASGTTLYTSGIASSVAAAGIATNPILKMIARYLATSWGTLFSSPSDIWDEAVNCGTMAVDVEVAGGSLKTVIHGVSKDDWEKMGREEANTTASKFDADATEVKEIFDTLQDILKSLAAWSMGGAVGCVTTGGIMLLVAWANSAGKILGPAAVASEITTVASGNALLAAVRGAVGKNVKVYITAATVAMALKAVLAQHSMSALRAAAHPVDKVPEFEQVYIPDLPTTDKKGKPLGDA
ncbi:hypothetical protein HTZ77_02105 [Nonomuraea sp. SMC257]|uniref:Uncharacterized protein n=1 Tax=Nonomuraea montanisoli TaxID=2741721 RepID=A0A7Y6M1A7_9ACTN|nr:hypothetical protein [Nonomuraea montanisoli]NUW30226.1 hypothetical protein [Nonomuraea montanisoli]